MTVGEAVRPTAAAMRVSWRTDGAVILASLVLVVAVVAGVVASQRAVEAAEEQSLVTALASAPADQTRLRVVVTDQFAADAGVNPLAAPQAAANDAASSIDPLVLSIYGPPRVVVDSPRFGALQIDGAQPASPTGIVLRTHDDLASRSTLLSGRAPRPTDEQIDGRPVFEVEVASQTAETMGWAVGTDILVESDPADPLFRVFTGVPDPFWVRVAGIAELAPPDDPYWSNDVRLHRPVVADTALGADFTAYASIPPDQLPVLLTTLGGRSGLRVEQRRDLDSTLVNLSNTDAIQRAITAVESATSATGGLGRPAVTIGLGPVLREESARRDVTRAAVLVANVGVMAVAVAALVQFQRVASARRRPWWRQADARGAPPATLVASSLASTVAVVGLGVAIGVALGTTLRDGAVASGRQDQRLLLILFALALIAASAADQIVEVRTRIRGDGDRPKVSRPRRAAGVLVVVVAVASVVTVRRRGITLEGDSVDAVLLVPIIAVPLAAVVLVAAIVPRLLRGRRVGSLRLGVGRLVGIRRGLTPNTEPGLMPVVALAMSITIVGVAVATSINSGITDQAWRDVGAPARIDTSDAAVVDRLAAEPGAVVARFGDTAALVEHNAEIVGVELVNVEVDGQRRLTDKTPIRVDTPDALGMRRDDGTLPAVATEFLGGRPVTIGDRITGVGSFADLEVTVVALTSPIAGNDDDALLVDRSSLESMTGAPASLDLAWFDGPIPPDIAADPAVDIVERSAIEAARLDDPLTRAARNAFIAAAAAAALLSVAAVVAHLVVTMRARRRDVGLLAALGADTHEFARSVRAELIPAVVLGSIIGAATGTLTIAVLDGRLDLGPLTGATSTPIALGVLTTVIVVAAILLTIVVVVALAGRRTSRSRSTAMTVLRAEGAR